MKRSTPEWELYERMIAQMIANQSSTNYCVTPNARLVGRISGRSRQIDVLIDLRHDTDNSERIIVDAKKRNRKIGVTEVEAFRGLMEDVGASHGILVSPSGYTQSAEKRAQATVSIRLVPLDRLMDFDPSTWPKCKATNCKNGRIFWDGYPELSMPPITLRKSGLVQSHDKPFVHYVGKCDRCGKFHVQCLTCGELFSVDESNEDDFGQQCRCKPLWFWIASIEEDEQGFQSAELHVVFLNTGKIITTDRRSLQ